MFSGKSKVEWRRVLNGDFVWVVADFYGMATNVYAEKIQSLLLRMNYNLIHTFGENNKAANFMTNHGFDVAKKILIDNFSHIFVFLSGILKVDKTGVSTIKCRK